MKCPHEYPLQSSLLLIVSARHVVEVGASHPSLLPSKTVNTSLSSASAGTTSESTASTSPPRGHRTESEPRNTRPGRAGSRGRYICTRAPEGGPLLHHPVLGGRGTETDCVWELGNPASACGSPSPFNCQPAPSPPRSSPCPLQHSPAQSPPSSHVSRGPVLPLTSLFRAFVSVASPLVTRIPLVPGIRRPPTHLHLAVFMTPVMVCLCLHALHLLALLLQYMRCLRRRRVLSSPSSSVSVAVVSASSWSLGPPSRLRSLRRRLQQLCSRLVGHRRNLLLCLRIHFSVEQLNLPLVLPQLLFCPFVRLW